MEKLRPNRLPRRIPAPHVRELLPLVLLAFACGAVLREPLACTRRVPPAGLPPARAVASARPAEPSASFAALAARGAAVAPGMREVARLQSAGDKIEIAHAEGRDACVRVAFEASTPVVAKLVDGEGNVLASSNVPATYGVLGERGPVCVRKGDNVSAVAEGADANVRWVAWASP
jgi:hypothetical protein